MPPLVPSLGAKRFGTTLGLVLPMLASNQPISLQAWRGSRNDEEEDGGETSPCLCAAGEKFSWLDHIVQLHFDGHLAQALQSHPHC